MIGQKGVDMRIGLDVASLTLKKIAQVNSCVTIYPQLQAAFHATVKKYAESLVRAGIRPVLFVSWAYTTGLNPALAARLQTAAWAAPVMTESMT